jgi:hypothetical protein
MTRAALAFLLALLSAGGMGAERSALRASPDGTGCSSRDCAGRFTVVVRR